MDASDPHRLSKWRICFHITTNPFKNFSNSILTISFVKEMLPSLSETLKHLQKLIAGGGAG
jgi:hypothetical protein